MARLEHWITHMIAQRQNADERKLLNRYALWHVVRGLRGRLAGADTTRGQSAAARGNIRAAIALLDWFTERGFTLATARQGALETWPASPKAPATAPETWCAGPAGRKLTRLDFAAVKWGGPTGIIDTETLWGQARWSLHDETVKPEDRVAGLLVLLYETVCNPPACSEPATRRPDPARSRRHGRPGAPDPAVRRLREDRHALSTVRAPRKRVADSPGAATGSRSFDAVFYRPARTGVMADSART
jgi:hypothetical protein